ncbi:SMI1/KNR4 family protein [Peribacillus alkalitolerans]|uniref:SMI1/KNR4 family protein n=1 Tax=Peribacillus alkalitolerans TaxID=1550385 RepID=UPI0013D1FBDE|nr:SMI1/KNR4 family protein [Peribacillus alkalitolerans]
MTRDDLFKNFNFNSPIKLEVINIVEEHLKIKFPSDYIDFMLKNNGGEGDIGNSYLRLWRMEHIVESNEDYAIEEFASGLIVIGSDGGGTAFGYDFRHKKPKLVEVNFIGLNLDRPFYSTESFLDFIQYLYKYEG